MNEELHFICPHFQTRPPTDFPVWKQPSAVHTPPCARSADRRAGDRPAAAREVEGPERAQEARGGGGGKAGVGIPRDSDASDGGAVIWVAGVDEGADTDVEPRSRGSAGVVRADCRGCYRLHAHLESMFLNVAGFFPVRVGMGDDDIFIFKERCAFIFIGTCGLTKARDASEVSVYAAVLVLAKNRLTCLLCMRDISMYVPVPCWGDVSLFDFYVGLFYGNAPSWRRCDQSDWRFSCHCIRVVYLLRYLCCTVVLVFCRGTGAEVPGRIRKRNGEMTYTSILPFFFYSCLFLGKSSYTVLSLHSPLIRMKF